MELIGDSLRCQGPNLSRKPPWCAAFGPEDEYLFSRCSENLFSAFNPSTHPDSLKLMPLSMVLTGGINLVNIVFFMYVGKTKYQEQTLTSAGGEHAFIWNFIIRNEGPVI